MKNLIISENQLNRLFVAEGLDWSANDDGTINLSINQDMTDKGNLSKNNADTRVFGTKNNVLYGDETTDARTKSLYDLQTSRRAAIELFKNVMEYVANGRQGDVSNIHIPENTDKATITSVMKWFSEGKSDNYIMDKCRQYIERCTNDYNVYGSTYDRVKGEQGDRVARYKTGIVQGTDVKFISLFTMNDFNFSDAIKHGVIRQNGNTDELLGIEKDDREGAGSGRKLAEIPITYDNGIQPNIAQNFSLNNVRDGHYKQQFGLNGEGGYTTISQFLDKSVNYAAYALKHEGFKADVIIAPPSSSTFNSYYCTNLSNKLGIPYVEDFFQRNVINVRLDKGKTTDEMLRNGFSKKDIMNFEQQVKNIAYKELAYFVSEPMRRFFNQYRGIFENISLAPHSREKTPPEQVFDCLMIYAYRSILSWIENGDTVAKHMVENFMAKQSKLYAKPYDSEHIKDEITSRINLKIGKRVFKEVLVETYNIMQQYSEMLKESGYKLRFGSKRFKVTQIPKNYRPYLKNVYIIADKALNNGELLSRYKNAKFILFDEDINTGTTFKLCIDALDEKLPMNSHSNIMCLVNGYSNSGW